MGSQVRTVLGVAGFEVFGVNKKGDLEIAFFSRLGLTAAAQGFDAVFQWRVAHQQAG